MNAEEARQIAGARNQFLADRKHVDEQIADAAARWKRCGIYIYPATKLPVERLFSPSMIWSLQEDGFKVQVFAYACLYISWHAE